MNLITTMRFITSHPFNRSHKIKALTRFAKWQINTLLNPYPTVYPFTDKTKLIIKKGMTGATGNLYCGLHEYYDMSFLLHFLREEDAFADVGANIGSYTILASGHAGSKTFSFEPVPSTFAHLVDNIAINHLENKVTAFNIALGSGEGIVAFTSKLDTVNHIATNDELDTIRVSIKTLNNIFENHSTPSLIKIDVEGFENEVLTGANRLLDSNNLHAIIIELNGSGKRYGYDDENIHKMLCNFDFRPFLYNPGKRLLSEIKTFNHYGNTLYVRNSHFVQNRLENANKIKIQDTEI